MTLIDNIEACPSVEESLSAIRSSAQRINETVQDKIIQNASVLKDVTSMLEEGRVLVKTDGQITAFNPGATTLFGCSPAGCRTEYESSERQRPHYRASGMSADYEYKLRTLTDKLHERDMALWSVPVATLTYDAHGHHVRGSEEYHALVGKPPHKLIGSSIFDLLPLPKTWLLEQEPRRAETKATLRTAGGLTQDFVVYKSPVRSADGKQHYGFVVSLIPFTSPNEDTEYVSSFIKAIEGVQTPLMLISSAECRVLLVNSAFCTKYGYDRFAVVNNSAKLFIDGPLDFTALKSLVRCGKKDASETMTLRVRTGLGAIVQVRTKVIPITSETNARMPKYFLLTEI
jgi:PAS domain-containing protein